MNYDKYFVDNEKVMSLEEVKKYALDKSIAFMLIKRPNKKEEDIFCLEKVLISSVHEKEDPFDEGILDTIISVITLSDEKHKYFSAKNMGESYVLLKTKPGEEYVKVFVENFVAQGDYCRDCRYCSNVKAFSDEYFKSHDASCFLFLTYLDYDRKIGEMIKCEECKKVTK